MVEKEKLKKRKKAASLQTRTRREKREKRKKLFKIFPLLVLVAVVLFFVLYKVVVSGKVFLQPFPKAIGHFEPTYEWRSDNQWNLLFVTVDDLEKKSAEVTGLYLSEFDPANKSWRILEIPVDIVVDAVGGRGEYKLSKIYALGAIQDQRENMLFLKDTFEKEFALPVDRYFIVDDRFDQFLKDQFGIQKVENFEDFFEENKPLFSGLRGVLNLFELKKNASTYFATNLSSKEFFQIGKVMSKVTPEKMSYTKMGEELLSKGDKNVDENEDGYYLNKIKLDLFLQNDFYDYVVRQEMKKVKVLNGSKVPKVAAQAARTIVNWGGELVETGNTELSDRVVIQVDTESKDSETIKRLQAFFGGKVDVVEISVIERAEIRVILGNNWVEKVYGRIE